MDIQRRRSHVIRGALAPVIGLVIGLVVLAPCLSLATEPPREPTPHTGLIVASSVYLLATPFDSAASLVESMARLGQPQAISACCGGAWRVHFAALLERPSGLETLDLEFHDVTSSDRSERPIHVLSSQISSKPADTTIFINDFVISRDLGFEAGHKYRVSLWRPGGSDRNALAEGLFTLE